MPLQIQVKIPDDRTKTGVLTLVDTGTGLSVYGPIQALG